MSDATVVSFQDAIRARNGGAPKQVVVDAADLKARQGQIAFEDCHAALHNVTLLKMLKTQEITVFHKLSVGFPKGRKIVVLGHKGSGKESIFDLFQRKRVPYRGSVLINSRISWTIPLTRFLDQQSTGRENALFISRVMGVSPRELMCRMLDFCELDENVLHEPLRDFPDWARRRVGLFVLLYCDFDLHLVANSFKLRPFNFSESQSELVLDLVYGGDYIANSEQGKNVPPNCNLAYVIFQGLLYQFDDVSQGIEMFEALPKPKQGPADSRSDDDEEDEDMIGEYII